MEVCPKCGRQWPLAAFGVRCNGKRQHWCRECHRQYQREYYLRRKDYYGELTRQRVERNRQLLRQAKSVPCADCGRRYPPYVMDFDHRPGEVKEFPLANIAGQTRISWKRIQAEIAKCDVVCANCHRIRTYLRRRQASSTLTND